MIRKNVAIFPCIDAMQSNIATIYEARLEKSHKSLFRSSDTFPHFLREKNIDFDCLNLSKSYCKLVS